MRPLRGGQVHGDGREHGVRGVHGRLPLCRGVVCAAAVSRRHPRRPDGPQYQWLPWQPRRVHHLPSRHELLRRLGRAVSVPSWHLRRVRREFRMHVLSCWQVHVGRGQHGVQRVLCGLPVRRGLAGAAAVPRRHGQSGHKRGRRERKDLRVLQAADGGRGERGGPGLEAKGSPADLERAARRVSLPRGEGEQPGARVLRRGRLQQEQLRVAEAEGDLARRQSGDYPRRGARTVDSLRGKQGA